MQREYYIQWSKDWKTGREGEEKKRRGKWEDKGGRRSRKRLGRAFSVGAEARAELA